MLQVRWGLLQGMRKSLIDADKRLGLSGASESRRVVVDECVLGVNEMTDK